MSIDYGKTSAADFQLILAAWARRVVVEGDVMPDYETMSDAEFQRTARDDPDMWADAAMVAAEGAGYVVDRDWLRSLLADAMEAARKGSIREVIEGDGA